MRDAFLGLGGALALLVAARVACWQLDRRIAAWRTLRRMGPLLDYLESLKTFRGSYRPGATPPRWEFDDFEFIGTGQTLEAAIEHCAAQRIADLATTQPNDSAARTGQEG